MAGGLGDSCVQGTKSEALLASLLLPLSLEKNTKIGVSIQNSSSIQKFISAIKLIHLSDLDVFAKNEEKIHYELFKEPFMYLNTHKFQFSLIFCAISAFYYTRKYKP